MDNIRPVVLEDLPLILSWRNNDSIRKHMFNKNIINTDEHFAWYQSSSKNNNIFLYIAEDNQIPFGFMQLRKQANQPIAEWGVYVAPDSTPGAGKRLAKLAFHEAFENLKLHKINSLVIETNAASVQFHQKIGFTREGVLRENYFNGKRFEDVICFGLIKVDNFMASNIS